TYNFTFHNKHFLCTARRLATKDGRVELLLSLKPDTSSTTIGSDGEKTLTEQTQLPILEVYNEILVLDREANTVKIVYRHDTRFDQSFSGTVDQAYAFERIESYVHPESLERFRAFIDPDTLDSRFSRMEGHYLSDPFQIKTKKGGYIWQTFILIPALVSGHKSVMICIRDSNIDVIRRVSAPGELISDDQLWKAISNSKDIGLFWKDKNQRFLGMNDTMMSYYNIDSVSSILGKNNEEVGLYPDPKPLESEEAAVLKDGKEVRGLSGTCVASGRLRPIEMNLAPVYDNGTISGILGYSINVDGNSDDTSSNLELLQTDETTGCLNALGLFSNGSAYCSLARNSGSDVVLVESEIENIGYLDRVFGQELVKDLAKKIATDLQNEFGTNGVVARTSRNRFCVCTSIANSDEAEKVSDTIQQIIEAPRNVGAADMQPHTFMAHALFSETKSFEDMYSLVERRIDDARANTQRDKDSDYVASVTTNELIHMMRMLEKTFDIVRIVNPTASEASELSKNSDELEVPYCCYTTWDRTEPCVNCISAKAVSRRMSQSKYEQFDGSIFYIVSQPILVDGKMMALEIGFALRTDAAGPDYKISRVFNMSEEEASKYRDEATRAYNRRFYDEELSSLIGSKIALVGINRFDELNAKFGFHASDTVMESIVNTLMGHTRIRDLVIHFSSDQALVIFDSAIPSNVFADRLILIRQSIDNTKLADYPDIHPDVTISAVDSARYVSDLVAKAEQQLDKARETGEKVALFSGSLVQESNEEK
ncbi:MAG: diguanylate cyclase domain-containing protein, partial [Coriobacteriales bacterium]